MIVCSLRRGGGRNDKSSTPQGNALTHALPIRWCGTYKFNLGFSPVGPEGSALNTKSCFVGSFPSQSRVRI